MNETWVTVRYAETDRMGIVHHAVYPVWYEEGRSAYFRALGLPYSAIEELGLFTPLSQLGCKFVRSCTYEDVLTVRTVIERLTPARIRFGYAVLRQGEMRPISTGFTEHGFVGRDMRPLSVKKCFPQLWQQLEKAATADADLDLTRPTDR